MTYSHTQSNISLLCEQRKTRLLRSGEVAERLGTHPLTVRRWVKESKISAMWAAILTVISVILALLLAFLQWYVPRSLSSPNPQASLASSPERVPTPLTDDQAYDTFIEREREKLSGRPNPHGTGMLVIRADKTLVNDSVVVGDKSAIISEHTEKGQRLYIGIIKDIKAGNAYATTPHRNPRGFTIHAREVAEIDLRNGR